MYLCQLHLLFRHKTNTDRNQGRTECNPQKMNSSVTNILHYREKSKTEKFKIKERGREEMDQQKLNRKENQKSTQNQRRIHRGKTKN